MAEQLAGWRAGDDVGEGAAAIDPELPAFGGIRCGVLAARRTRRSRGRGAVALDGGVFVILSIERCGWRVAVDHSCCPSCVGIEPAGDCPALLVAAR